MLRAPGYLLVTLVLCAQGCAANQAPDSGPRDAGPAATTDAGRRADGGADGHVLVPDAGGSAPDAGGDDAGSPEDAGAPAQRGVWPGTTTRFSPGIYYFGGRNPSPADVTRVFDRAFAAYNDGEDWRARDDDGDFLTHVGVYVQLNLRDLYVDESLAPAAYDVTCARSPVAADPSWSNYDWAYVEDLLSVPFVADGRGKLYVALDDTHAQPLPAWMVDQGMVDTARNPGATGRTRRAALWRRAATNALMDFYEAFARRFAGDERIAAVMITETNTGSTADRDIDTGASSCGNIDGLTGRNAHRQGRVYQAVALKAGDPDLMVMVMNMHRSMETGYGPGLPGMNDLPGQWGTLNNGGRLFNTDCGSGSYPEIDCGSLGDPGRATLMLRQEYGLLRSHPTGIDTQTNEWTNSAPSCCRLGSQNPWGYASWPVVRGFWPGQGGEWKNQPTPQHWVWYNSGEPTGTEGDSGLGQTGRDPGGVSPVSFYLPRPTNQIRRSDTDSTVADTRTYESFADAFDTFGPLGTGAMFSTLPAGYRAAR